jgi:hypothetical protein
MYVIFDSCVIDLLAERGADPVKDLRGSEFVIAYTPDLKEEYLCAVRKETIAAQIRDLHIKILDVGEVIGFFGWGPAEQGYLGWGGYWAHPSQRAAIESIPTKERRNNRIPENRTDAHMIALARDVIVITNNFRQPHWKKAPLGTGRVIMWKDFEKMLIADADVASAVRRLL